MEQSGRGVVTKGNSTKGDVRKRDWQEGELSVMGISQRRMSERGMQWAGRGRGGGAFKRGDVRNSGKGRCIKKRKS
jgi:hypothetical protein